MADFRARQRIQIHDGTDEFGVLISKPIFSAISDGTEQLEITAAGEANTLVNNASGASAVNIQDGGNSITIDDGAGSITVDGTVSISGSVTVVATDLDIRDLTSASDSVEVLQDTHDDLNANVNLQIADTDVDASNPVPVSFVSGTAADQKHEFDTATAVAKDATDNHDVTVTGAKTFLLKSVIAAASGAMKLEVQTGPVAGLVTNAVFFTSGAKPTEQIIFDPPIEVPDTSTGTIRVIRRNDDNQAMDVYSTIIGEEV